MAALIRFIVATGVTIAGRAVLQAYKNITSNPAAAKQATENLASSTAKAFGKGIQLEEARMVLNIKDVKEGIDPKEVAESFTRLYTMNDVEKGGSFYLQSKIFRAKECLEDEMRQRNIPFDPIEIPVPEPKPAEADASATSADSSSSSDGKSEEKK